MTVNLGPDSYRGRRVSGSRSRRELECECECGMLAIIKDRLLAGLFYLYGLCFFSNLGAEAGGNWRVETLLF